MVPSWAEHASSVQEPLEVATIIYKKSYFRQLQDYRCVLNIAAGKRRREGPLVGQKLFDPPREERDAVVRARGARRGSAG